MAQIIMRGSVAYYLVQRARIKYLIFLHFILLPIVGIEPGLPAQQGSELSNPSLPLSTIELFLLLRKQ